MMKPTMNQFLNALCSATMILLLAGCQPTPAELYPIGTPRQVIHQRMGEPASTAHRTASGKWRAESQEDSRVASVLDFAVPARSATSAGATFDSDAAVQFDTFVVPRGFMGLGLWYDNVFYGTDETVVGHDRLFID